MTKLDQSPRIIANAVTAAGWSLTRLTGPSRLYGANGLRIGPDGRIYVAQVAGSAVSAVDPDSGAIEVISGMDGEIVAPDDLAFDDHGNLYSTEITLGRVSVRRPDGGYRVLAADVPCANPISFHQGHLYAGECRPGGRIMEIDRKDGSLRIILDNVPMPNAFEVGPDGWLYFPVMGTNEIWRVHPAGGQPEVVARDLGVPDSVKFDATGHIISTQVASGQVLRIDPATGQKTVLAQLTPGLDNCALIGSRIFVSNINGQLSEILPSGQVRDLAACGLQWPMGLALDTAGRLYICDGAFAYTIAPGGPRELVGMLFSPGYPGFNRGVCAHPRGGWLVTTANGDLAHYRPEASSSEILASGYDRLMDVALSPGGAAVFTEYGTGRVHAIDGGTVRVVGDGLAQPVGIAFSANGVCYVSDSATGRVVRLDDGHFSIVLDGLGQAEGLAVHGDTLYVIDVQRRELLALDLVGGGVSSIATGLPVGGPMGCARRQLGPVGTLSGPMHAFTGLACAADGRLFVSGDAEGSVLVLSRS